MITSFSYSQIKITQSWWASPLPQAGKLRSWHTLVQNYFIKADSGFDSWTGNAILWSPVTCSWGDVCHKPRTFTRSLSGYSVKIKKCLYRCLLVLLLRVHVNGLYICIKTREIHRYDSNDENKHRKRVFRKPIIPIGRKEYYFALLQC